MDRHFGLDWSCQYLAIMQATPINNIHFESTLRVVMSFVLDINDVGLIAPNEIDRHSAWSSFDVEKYTHGYGDPHSRNSRVSSLPMASQLHLGIPRGLIRGKCRHSPDGN